MASRTFTINQDGNSRTFTVNTGVGPQGPAGANGADGAPGTTLWSGLTGEANHIPFDTTPTSVPTTNGTLSWNAGDACLEYAVDGGTISIGKETFDYYTNLSGAEMIDGDIVSIVGATGNRTAVDLTDATDATSSANVIGMVTQGAANNGTVRVTKAGSVHLLNTNGLTEGGTIYVDPAHPGKWTMTRPERPNHVVSIGVVQVAHAVNGVADVVPNHQCRTVSDIIGLGTAATADATEFQSSGVYPLPITSLVFMGDSISSDGNLTDTTAYLGWQDALQSVLGKDAPAIPNGVVKSFAASGRTTAAWLSTAVPQVIALSPRPSHALTMIGTNDQPVSVTAAISNLTTGVASLRAAGIEPLFVMFPGSEKENITRCMQNLELAEAMVAWAKSSGVWLFDGREKLNDPVEKAAEIHGSLFDAIHPDSGWYGKMATALAPKLEVAASGWDSLFDAGPAINANPSNASDLVLVSSPPSDQYESSLSGFSYVTRTDGVTGRWARLAMTYKSNRALVLHSGDSQVTYSPVAPWTADKIFVQHANVASTTSTPTVSVHTPGDVVYIYVTAKVLGGAYATSAAVAAAVNAAASSYVTATAGGTGLGLITVGTLPVGAWRVEQAYPAEAEVSLLENDQVRIIAEMRVARGELAYASLICYSKFPTATSRFDMVGTPIYSVCPFVAGDKAILKSNWFSVGSNGSGGPLYSGWKPRLDFGGRSCVLDIGRIWIQRRPTP